MKEVWHVPSTSLFGFDVSIANIAGLFEIHGEAHVASIVSGVSSVDRAATSYCSARDNGRWHARAIDKLLLGEKSICIRDAIDKLLLGES